MDSTNRRGQRLLEHFKENQALGADAQTRLLSELQARVATGQLPRADVPPPELPAQTLSTAMSSGMVVKGVVAVAIATAASWAVMRAASTDEPASRSTPPALQARTPTSAPDAPAPALGGPPAVVAEPEAPTAAPEAAPAHRDRTRARKTRAAAPSVPVEQLPAPAQTQAGDSLEAEMALLRTAHAAMRASQPTRALAALAEHRQRFPRGELAESRDVANVLALCSAGKVAAARAEAARFLKLRPGSPFADRVRSACIGTP